MKFFILLGHKHFFFGFYYIPGIILRIGVSCDKDTSSLPLWSLSSKTDNKGENKKKNRLERAVKEMKEDGPPGTGGGRL